MPTIAKLARGRGLTQGQAIQRLVAAAGAAHAEGDGGAAEWLDTIADELAAPAYTAWWVPV